MKFQHSLLAASLLAVLASPTVFASDDASGSGTGEGDIMNGAKVGDTQTAHIAIPEVSMIDVTNDIKAELEPPKDAGDNFKTVSIGEKSTYDISANIPAKEPKATKKIVVNSSAIPAGWMFGIEMKPPAASGASTGKQTLTSATVGSVDLVNGIQNVAERGLGLAIEIGPENANEMPSHTSGAVQEVKLVYTITAG